MSPALGVLALLVAVLAYGLSTLLLAAGAHSDVLTTLRNRVWIAGTAAQGVGFVGAFAARHSLPLLVVQPAVSASVAVSCLIGVLSGRFRLHRSEWLTLMLVVTGVAAVGSAGSPGTSRDLGPLPLAVCVVAAILPLVALVVTPTPASATMLGLLAGVAFSASAVAARALAADPWAAVVHDSGRAALATLLAGTVVGELVLTRALATGRMTSPVSAMYLVTTVAPAMAGLVWLGDAVRAGWWPVAVVGVALATVASIRLQDVVAIQPSSA